MVNRIFSQISLRNVTILLLVLYPLDQLHTTIFEDGTFPSPYKIIIGTYLFFVIKLNGINNTFASKSVLLLLFGMVTLSALSILWAYSDYFLAIKYTLQLLVLWSFTVVAVKILGHDEKAIKSIFFYWLVVSAIVSYYALSGALSPSELSEGRRISFRAIGLNAIAISIGYALVLGVSGFSLFKNERIKQLLMVIAMLISFWMLVRLGTRSVIWGFVITVLTASLINLNIKNVMISVVVLFSMLLALNYVIENNYLAGRLLERLVFFNLETFQENDRLEIWRVGLEWFSSNPLGSGAGNEALVYETLSIANLEAHNVIVSSIIQFGVLGGVLLLIILATLTMKIYKFKG